MNDTAHTLHAMAFYIDRYGLHTGDQFADNTQLFRFDICAIAYLLAERSAWPDAFFTDEVASLALIESSEPAMNAIRAISAELDSDVCETNGQPDYIEHVSNWTATRAPFDSAPPTTREVIDRIHRAIDALATRPQTNAA